jgi:hypothetical protein
VWRHLQLGRLGSHAAARHALEGLVSEDLAGDAGYQLTEPPRLSCVTAGHIMLDMVNKHGVVIGGWCLWCGQGAYDAKHVSKPFTYRLRTLFS